MLVKLKEENERERSIDVEADVTNLENPKQPAVLRPETVRNGNHKMRQRAESKLQLEFG